MIPQGIGFANEATSVYLLRTYLTLPCLITVPYLSLANEKERGRPSPIKHPGSSQRIGR